MTVWRFFLTVFLFLSILSGYLLSNYDLYYLALFITFLFFGLLIAIAIPRGILSSGFAFLSLFGLFHFGIGVSYVLFPQYVTGIFAKVLDVEHIKAAFFISLSAAISFSVGYLWNRHGQKSPPYLDLAQSQERQIPVFWILVFTLFATVYCYQGFSQNIFFSPRQVYISLSDTGNARVFGLSRQLMILVSFVLIAKIPSRYVYWVPFLVVLLLSPMILSGKRGEFITILASYAVIFPLRGVHVSRKQVLVALIILVPLMSILRIERGGYITQGNPLTDLALEGGTQVRTVAYTVDALKSGIIEHQYGSTYLRSLAVVIPNIGGLRGTILPDDKGPAQWFTDEYNNGGAGIGYSIAAEAYLNGGLPFVVFFMGMLGLLLSRLELAAVRSKIWLSLFGAMLMSLFWWIRNDSAGFFRPVAWVVLLFYIDYLIKFAINRRVR